MLVFIALWGHCDRRGVFPWQPRQLALDILPFVWKERMGVELQQSLELLESAGFVQRFEAEGKAWGWVPGFSEHQRISGKETNSALRYPGPPQAQEGRAAETHGEAPVERRGSTREAPGKDPGALERGARKGNRKGNLSVCCASSPASALPARGIRTPQHFQHTHTPPTGSLTFNPHEREPTPEEIRTTAAMRGYPQIDAEGFLEHYRATGWMRGTTPIVDWRPLITRWREVDRTRQSGQARASPGSNGRGDRKRSGKGLAAAMEKLTEIEHEAEVRHELERGEDPGGEDLRALPGKRRPG